MARTTRLTHCGGAQITRAGQTVLAVALSARWLELAQPIPRRVARGTTVPIVATLARGYGRPTLAVTGPDGSTQRIPLPAGRDVRHTLRFERAGEHTLELLAEGPEGMAVLAVAPLWVGDAPEPPLPAYQEGRVETDADAVRARLEALINQARRARGLPPLEVDEPLARVALAHCEDMAAHDFVAHTSKATGDASDRLARAGLKAKLLLENIGRGYSASEIHDGLMASPGHRANLLHPQARRMGIGVVKQSEGDRYAFLVTELFTNPGR
jgi:uncharacterized protein YkwD